MRKFFAVVKREYVQRVRTKFFVVATILGPLLMAAFTIVPPLMFGIRAGGPTRLAIVDQTGKMYERVTRELMNSRDRRTEVATEQQPPTGPSDRKEQISKAGKLIKAGFEIEEVHVGNRSLEEVTKGLEARILNRELDGYVLLPSNLLKDGQPQFRARNSADVFTKDTVKDAISDAVRGQRLVDAGIDEKAVTRASEPVELKTIEASGKENKGEASFFLVFGMGLLIYM